MNPFRAPFRAGADWLFVGLTSSFPDLGTDDDNLSEVRNCSGESKPGCRVFYAPKVDSLESSRSLVAVEDLESCSEWDLKDQVLVFQYRGKFHAVDNKCPHSSYPLSKGTAFDIEDFGVVLSAGITCPKHGWSFDLFTGIADRGNYRLKLWEIQLRDITNSEQPANTLESTEREIWVRRKQRIG